MERTKGKKGRKVEYQEGSAREEGRVVLVVQQEKTCGYDAIFSYEMGHDQDMVHIFKYF